MSLRRVRNLVTHHAGKVIFAVEELDQAGIKIQIAAGSCERVEDFVVAD